MIIFFAVGVLSFLCVGILWIISHLIQCPIILESDIRFPRAKRRQADDLDQQQAAVTTATSIILHPPS